MKCTKCNKPIKENTDGNDKYCQGHSIFSGCEQAVNKINKVIQKKQMKKFKVFATSVTHYSIEVEAENKDEAWHKADEADGGDFSEVMLGDWHIETGTIEEIK